MPTVLWTARGELLWDLTGFDWVGLVVWMLQVVLLAFGKD